jgi:hypothetical protein
MKDMLGQEVNVGDYFAYPLVAGRSANMAIYQFKEETVDGKVKAKPITRTYGNEYFNQVLNLPSKYCKWVHDKGEFQPMTQKERDKVDFREENKRSTLLMFTDRAIKLKDFNEAA